jgi:hypothetical protein
MEVACAASVFFLLIYFIRVASLRCLSALRDLYRRRGYCWSDLKNWCRLGSTRFKSPLMGSSKFVTSRLYAIHFAADGIFKIRDIPALRDSFRCWWDLQNSWYPGSTRFKLSLMGSSKFVTSRLYAIHIGADGIFKMRDISALRDSYRRRCDLQNAWHLVSTRFISPMLVFTV